MKSIDFLAAIVVIVGALNWGLIGLFRFDFVPAVFGDATALSRFAYIVVGAAGLYKVLQWKAIQERA